MNLAEEIEKEKIARNLEILRNDLLVFIFFDFMYFFWLTYTYKNVDCSKVIDRQIVFSILFYNLFFLKIIISSFIFNVKNDSRFMFFAPLFLFQSGLFFGWIFHFSKSIIWFWKNKPEANPPVIQRMKLISNTMLLLTVSLFLILIYINSKEGI